MLFEDKLMEECGVVGVYSTSQEVSKLAFFALYALQHRGQESAGIASLDGTEMNLFTSMGLVSQAIHGDDLLQLKGDKAIGHTRYSTTGSSNIRNAQPLISEGPEIKIALAHNGNVVNAKDIKEELIQLGCNFSSSSDSEIIANLITHSPYSSWSERISYMMRKLKGAYSLTILTEKGIIGIRDPLGVRPLCVGSLNEGFILASESCALDNLGAKFIREIKPGEAVLINENGIQTIFKSTEKNCNSCIFEHIYFARPDSILDDQLVYHSRMLMGSELAKEHPVDADFVIGIPDSATAAAVGYSQESGIPYSEGLVKNRYVGRTFIQPDQKLRDLGVKTKLNPLTNLISGKRLVVVDDSIVRGTTTPHVVKLLKNAGVLEIHLRITAPPIKFPCQLGIDMATKKELIASNMSTEEICNFVGADSLGYLSLEGLMKTMNKPSSEYCTGCFTGNHPVPFQLELDKLNLEL